MGWYDQADSFDVMGQLFPNGGQWGPQTEPYPMPAGPPTRVYGAPKPPTFPAPDTPLPTPRPAFADAPNMNPTGPAGGAVPAAPWQAALGGNPNDAVNAADPNRTPRVPDSPYLPGGADFSNYMPLPASSTIAGGPVAGGGEPPGQPMPLTPTGAGNFNVGPDAYKPTPPPGDPRAALAGMAQRGQLFGDPTMAGLASSFSAIGQRAPRGSKLGAFLGGAGAGMTGAQKQQWLEREQSMKENNQLFNQASKNFNDWIRAEQLGNQGELVRARSRYFDSLSKMGGGKNAWIGSDHYRALELEKMLDREFSDKTKRLDAQRKALESAMRYGSPGPARQAEQALQKLMEEYQNLEKERDSRREERAKAIGISPNAWKQGITQDNAFDWDKLSAEQQRTMPDGSWVKYKDKNGQIQYGRRDYLTNPPYPGWSPLPQQQPQQGNPQATYAALQEPLPTVNPEES